MTIPPPGPLAYQGQVVVPFINRTFAPSSSNNEFSVPTVWVDTAHSDAYMLVSKPLGIANWLNLGTGGPVSSITITGNSGGSVSPDVGGNFNFLGSGNITIVGTPLTNTLTASLTGTTNHAVQVGNSSGSLTSIGLGTTNTVLLGQTGAAPAFGLVPNAALQNSTIDVIAGAGITVVGSPVALGNSVTISATTVTPTTFTEDSGSASPAANNLNILGTSAQGISTSGSGSTVTLTAANATSSQKGVASFNGTEFTVTSGAVTSNAMTVTAGTGLTGGGSLNLGGSTSIALTVPVTVPHGGTGLTSTPTNGQLLIGNTGTAGYNLSALTSTGGSVAITNGAGSINLEVAATTLNSLTGDTGGAVSPTAGNIDIVGTAGQITVTGTPGTSTLTLALAGGGTAVDSIAVDAATGPGTNPVVPTGAGLVTMTGGQVASGTVGANVLRTNSVLANNVKLEIQRSAAVAATDSTKNGVAHFSSDEFAVDANGFVTLVGGSEAIDSFVPDSGTSPVVPAANGSVTMSGAGSITTVGGLNSLTTQLTGLTNHNVLVGAGTTTITKVAPSATSGVPLISQGAAADPAFGTAVVAGGGTGAVTLTGVLIGNGTSAVTGNAVTNHDVLVGGASNAITSVSPSTAGFVLTSNGVAADPSFQTVSASGAITTITGNSGGAEVPTAGGNFNILGTGSITVAGSANTETVQLTGLTNHAVLVGAATATITNVGPSATTGAPLISGGAAADPGFSTTFTIVDSTATSGVSASKSGSNVTLNCSNTSNTASSDASFNVTTGGASARHSYMQYSILGGVNWSQGVIAGSDTFWIASRTGLGGDIRLSVTTGGAVTFNNAFTFPTADGTAGQVLTTNGAGTVTWSSSGVGTWTDTSGVFTASRNSAYFLTAASTATLPASPAQGDTVDFVCDTTGSCVITGNTGQFIRIASQLSSAAGTATNSARGDTLSLVYRAATTTWFAFDAPNGGWTTA